MHLSPISTLAFRWPWRPYQARVLQAIHHHLKDRKLHLVAAPGSGKTILGLETFRLLGRPALVLSPTRTIRDQWLKRLEDFLPPGTSGPLSWTSTDLNRPAFFTSITYQALHTRHRRDIQDREGEEEGAFAAPGPEEVRDVVSLCRKAGFRTLILDEAHHLRTEWWKVLKELADGLEGAVLVALTATPPYDATGREWNRYQELCGPIDEEISVPELVKAGNLCPHQDYLWLVAPALPEQTLLHRHDQAVEGLQRDLLSDPEFRHSVRNHPWVLADAPDPEEVLASPELAVALLVCLKALGFRPPKRIMDLLSLRPADLPPLDRRWWQVLAQAYLFDSRWALPQGSNELHRAHLARRLRAHGLLWRRELRLLHSKPLRNRLSLTPTKIEACLHIYRMEREARGDDLRQVLLTDFIREDYPESSLGAWPLFQYLAKALSPTERTRLGLISGRMTILPERIVSALEADGVTGQPLPGLEGYLRLRSAGGEIVHRVTGLLMKGELRVLVGTRALLGEGWDAPAVNSIVLATAADSFMITNQLRGRAIRIDPDRTEKAASIWHLAALDPGTPSGLEDLEDVSLRFRTFVGLAADAPVIESGLERLDLPFFRQGEIRPGVLSPLRNNEEMERRLGGISGLRSRWMEAVKGEEKRILPAVRSFGAVPFRFRSFHFRRTLAYLLLEGVLLFFAGAAESMWGMRTVLPRSSPEFLLFLAVAALGGAALALPRFFRAVKALIRHLPVDGSLRQIALSLRDALCEAGLVRGDPSSIEISSRREADGSFTAALEGGDFYERALFADCLREILSPIENPRYLIVRQSRWRRRNDYHAVPQVLAAEKEKARIFHRAWIRRVGPAGLVFTRTPEGRLLLLKARSLAFSTAMVPHAERLDRWQ